MLFLVNPNGGSDPAGDGHREHYALGRFQEIRRHVISGQASDGQLLAYEEEVWRTLHRCNYREVQRQGKELYMQLSFDLGGAVGLA